MQNELIVFLKKQLLGMQRIEPWTGSLAKQARLARVFKPDNTSIQSEILKCYELLIWIDGL